MTGIFFPIAHPDHYVLIGSGSTCLAARPGDFLFLLFCFSAHRQQIHTVVSGTILYLEGRGGGGRKILVTN